MFPVGYWDESYELEPCNDNRPITLSALSLKLRNCFECILSEQDEKKPDL